MNPEKNEIAEALRHVFVSPNVSDSNFEPANLVDTTQNIGASIHELAKQVERIADYLQGR